MPPKSRSHHERFWAFVPDRPADGCWIWQGSRMPRGYGKFAFKGESQYAHRLAYIFAKGPIPNGLELHHTCRVTPCVNPEHLVPVTGAENMRYELGRTVYGVRNREKTHCHAGHAFNYDNTYYYDYKGSVGRSCRTCKRYQMRMYRQRRRAA